MSPPAPTVLSVAGLHDWRHALEHDGEEATKNANQENANNATDASQFPARKHSKSKRNSFGDTFRNYEESKRQEIVARTYRLQHTNQTVAFVRKMQEKWLAFDKGEYTIMEMIDLLDTLIDDSDPDNDLPNSIHDFQTAERIRAKYPEAEYDWFHLIGLLHDIGKVLALPQVAGADNVLPQWAVVGDTFPVGCQPAPEIVFGVESFAENPDFFVQGAAEEVKISRENTISTAAATSENEDVSKDTSTMITTDGPYNTSLGMYTKNCGLDALLMSWGHDEYMYQVLKANNCTLPKKGLDMIRYHSFYPWHEKRAYTHLESVEDREETLPWVREFNTFDLYSKADSLPDVEKLKPYYQRLLKKYNIGGKIKW
ncbi:unnamed protein product [Amoebophrya sp. A25]|nr:unnamed protein product [Amoebophrya sp. A25]|eukprot:GSA25T00021223001.1